jgi:hypothetical protein
MKFYAIDDVLRDAIDKADTPVRLRIDIERGGHFESVFEQDIIEAHFFALKEVEGGTSTRGEVILDNPQGIYSVSSPGQGAGREVRISFSMGEGLPYFQRFIFFVGDNGFQDIRGLGRKRYIRMGLRDRSVSLRKTDESRDWSAPATLTYVIICDKTQPDKSLVHLMAQRVGLAVNDIDCATIPLKLPYVKITKNIWDELSELALTYRAHLECAPEKPLVFAHSPYQVEPFIEDDYSYTFTGKNIFYLRTSAKAGDYRNSIRLKVNMPVALEKQEIWRYADVPIMYDETSLTPRFPFRLPALREIEHQGYEAPYTLRDNTGKERAVLYADQVDTKELAESRLEFEGGPFSYSIYDVNSHHDKALITLHGISNGELFRAVIHGRPIVADLNRSCYRQDTEALEQFGTVALNVTGSYFSEDLTGGRPHYEDWVIRELAERLVMKREITVKTHRALFHGRVGAKVQVKTKEETMKGTINSLSLRYRRNAAFEATFKIQEAIDG